MRTIQTARLLLVPVTPANANRLWNVIQQPDLRDFQDLPNIDLDQFLRAVAARPTQLVPGTIGRFEWLMHLAAGEAPKEPLGWVSLRVADPDRTTGEIGYSVVREYRGRGFATEAVAALIAEGFNRARLRQIRAYCLPENRSSRAVLRRNGFRDDGTLAHGATVQGKAVDVVAHSLGRNRWAANATPRQATGS